jgi:hypothetical protein
MADPLIFPSLISKDNDQNAVDNAIFVQLSDGTTEISVTGTSLDVNLTNASIEVTSNQLDIDDLVAGINSGEDNVLIFANTSKDGTGTDYVPLVDADGHLQMDVLTHAFTNTNAIPISKDNDANSETNPIFVKVTDTSVSGVEIQDFNQAVDVGAGLTDNHDYTVVNTTMLVSSVIVSASGNAKFEIQVDNGAGYISKAVGFLTGREGDTKQVEFKPALEATTSVRIIRTNRQNQAQDLYSTIIGNDV